MYILLCLYIVMLFQIQKKPNKQHKGKSNKTKQKLQNL